MRKLIALFMLVSILYLFTTHQNVKPYHRHPELTKQEKRMIKQAISKHGDYLIIRERGFIMLRSGKRIKL